MLKYVSSNVSFRISCKRSFKLFSSRPLKSQHRSLLMSRTEDRGWRWVASDFSRTVLSGGLAHLRLHFGFFSSLWPLSRFNLGHWLRVVIHWRKYCSFLVLYSKIYVAWLVPINFSASHRGSRLKEMQSTVSAPAIETLISLTCDHIPNERNCINLRKNRNSYHIEAQQIC